MLEAHGLPTIALSAMLSRTLRINPPRSLFTGYQNAEIVGPPGDAETQRATLRRAFRVLREATDPGAIVDLRDDA
jgi:hypothetical protein